MSKSISINNSLLQELFNIAQSLNGIKDEKGEYYKEYIVLRNRYVENIITQFPEIKKTFQIINDDGTQNFWTLFIELIDTYINQNVQQNNFYDIPTPFTTFYNRSIKRMLSKIEASDIEYQRALKAINSFFEDSNQILNNHPQQFAIDIENDTDFENFIASLEEFYKKNPCNVPKNSLEIIKLRYGLEPYDRPHTLQEIAEELGVSRSEVDRQVKKFFGRYRIRFKNSGYQKLVGRHDLVDDLKSYLKQLYR